MTDDDILERLVELTEGRFFGKYRGIVDGHEPIPQRGRVKLRVPAVLGDLSVLAEVCVPYAGDGTGLMLLPEPDSGCWVEFEGGDPSYPIFVGAYWGDGKMPDPLGGTNPRLLRSANSELRLDEGTQTLTASSDQGGTVTLDAAATLTAGAMSGEVKAEMSGASMKKTTKKVEVSDVMVSVNGGNLDVN